LTPARGIARGDVRFSAQRDDERKKSAGHVGRRAKIPQPPSIRWRIDASCNGRRRHVVHCEAPPQSNDAAIER